MINRIPNRREKSYRLIFSLSTKRLQYVPYYNCTSDVFHTCCDGCCDHLVSYSYALDIVSYSSELSSNIKDFQYNKKYVQFLPLKFDKFSTNCSNNMIFSSLTDFDNTKEYCRSRNFYSFFHFRNFGPQNFLKIDFFKFGKF